MKPYVITLLILMQTQAFASECSEIMKSLLKSEQKLKVTEATKDFDLLKYGLEETPVNRQKFERLYAQCLSPNKNDVKDLASKNLKKTFLGMSIATTVIGYTNNNWSKPKDAEWFERLGYGLVFGAACGKVYGSLVKDNGNRFQYIIKDYLFGRGATLGYALGATLIFSNNKSEQEKINKLKNSPTFKQDLQKLEKYINQEGFIERYKKELFTYLGNENEISLGIGVQEGVDFDHLTPKDLEDKDIQKVVLAAILAQEYDHSKGPISTGNGTEDFFLYDSMYSLAKIPKDILVQKLTNRVMCLNLHNPKRGLTQAIGINALNQILFADYYSITYKVLKKEVVGGE